MSNLIKNHLIYKIIFLLIGLGIIVGIVEVTFLSDQDKKENNEVEEYYSPAADCRY